MAQVETVIILLEAVDVPAVMRIYAEAISRSYIAYEEVTKGLATPERFSKTAVKSFKQEIVDSIGSRVCRVYVARYEGVPAGFVNIELKKVAGGHRECWILDIGVEKRFRKMGIAKKLMRETYAFGKKNKVKYFFLESGASNVGAHEFFEKEGFAPLSTIFVKKG